MKTCIINGKVILEDKIVEENLYFDNGIITEISSRSPENEEIIDAKGLYVSPGFIEMHSHGRVGCDCMDATFESLNNITTSTLKTGVTSYMPTTMTMSIEDTAKAIKNIADNKDKVGGSRIIGIHMEGPFFSKKYKGAQPEEYMIPVTIENFKALTGGLEDEVKKISLAPELENACELIKYLSDKGILVSMGHTNATYEEAMKGVEAGIRSGTHTFNAMSALTHRAPGVVGAVMDSDVYAELILDGMHVSWPAARILMKTKGYDKVTLITDSLEAADLPAGQYMLAGQPVWVVNGVCKLENGTIAGSITSMNKEVYNAIHYCNVPLIDAVKMASTNAAKALNRDDIGSLAVGKKADIIIFDDDINIKTIILEGNVK